MDPENPEGTQAIVDSMNMGYISDSARNRTHNLFRPRREPIPLGHSDGMDLWSICNAHQYQIHWFQLVPHAVPYISSRVYQNGMAFGTEHDKLIWLPFPEVEFKLCGSVCWSICVNTACQSPLLMIVSILNPSEHHLCKLLHLPRGFFFVVYFKSYWKPILNVVKIEVFCKIGVDVVYNNNSSNNRMFWLKNR